MAEHFLVILRNELGKPLPGISQSAMGRLAQYRWPGNIRELKNCIERAAILVDNTLIQPEHLIVMDRQEVSSGNPGISEPGMVSFNFAIAEADLSVEGIMEKAKTQVLDYCDNNKTRAAKLLKRSRTFFYRK